MAAHIIELLRAEDASTWSTSFEFYPPRSEKAETDFMNTVTPAFVAQSPLFMDLTWGAGGRTSDTTMRLCKQLQAAYPKVPINMHITCTNMPAGLIKTALDFAKENGIRNIVALRGDAPEGEEFHANPEGFACARTLVQYIRANYGDFFCIAVAGYPEGHPSVIADDFTVTEADYQKELEYLKTKVDAGADFIITQLFYDPALFVSFVARCRAIGIQVPILPGLLPITTYKGFERIVQLCKTRVPAEMHAKVEALKDDDVALKAYGVEQCLSMIHHIRDSGIPFHHLHFYTLNCTGQTFKILDKLGALHV